MKEENLLKLKTGAVQLGIELTEKQLQRFEIYADFLLQYNQKINLTTVTCLLYTSPSPRDGLLSRMPSSA